MRQATGQRLINVRMQKTKNSIGPILFSYYEENLVSSNLNLKQLRFHGAHPNLHTVATHLRDVALMETQYFFSKGHNT
jgi:hypothetical protein